MCIHKNSDGTCHKHSSGGALWFCVGLKCPDYEMSNADQFRNMTDAELAAFIASNNVKSLCDIVCGDKCKAVARNGVAPWVACRETVAKWLKRRARTEASPAEWAGALERVGKHGTGSD